jgi:hypothetical protein
MKRMIPTSQVADAILGVLSRRADGVSAAELTRELPEYAPWQIREAIWDLTAASQAELTWDWKLRKPGTKVNPAVIEATV